MDATHTLLAQKMRSAASRKDVSQLVGKFHAHLSVTVAEEDVPSLRELCKSLKTKLTVVQLENATGLSQQDVMTTSYFQDSNPLAVARIAAALISTADALHAAGYTVVRAKLEHESTPTLSEFDQHRYHEVHIKLRIDRSRFDEVYAELRKIGTQYGFVPSRNPFEQCDDYVTQFVNARIYQGNRQEADSVVEQMLARLEQLDLKVMEVKRETVVFDTNQNLDAWWTK